MTGTPQLPPEWSFGLWISRWTTIGYKSVEKVKEILDKFELEGIPWDVLSMDPHWTSNYYTIVPNNRYVRTYACEFSWNRDYFERDNDVGDLLRGHGKRLCLNIDPYVMLNGNHIRKVKDCLLTDGKGNIALMPRFDDPEMPDRGMIDFTREECFRRYSEIVKDLILRSNADTVMTDLGEIVPPNAVDSHGNPGYMIRNLMGDLYQASSYEGVRQARGSGILWGRSGSLLKHNYPIEWGGDSVSSWEGMRTSLRAALSACMSGTIFTAFDSGGFVGRPGRLLYIRWVAMGALFSHFKIHGTTPREPWNYDKEIVDAFKELVNLRYRLMPYIIHQAKVSLNEKIPMIRPLVLEFPEDEASKNIDDEYLLGSDILVAPIFSDEGYRKVYLPPGRWVDFFDRTEYSGKCWINITASIMKIPLFVKKDATIEMVEQVPGNNVETTLKNNTIKMTF
jgi:alpha-D-xyloside xylohydrolase